jgi:hypothetical protein
MNRSLYKTLAALLWLGPVVVWLRYRELWEQLPPRMATHFNAAGVANGWMTKEMSLNYSVGFVALLAGIFSVVLFVMLQKYELTKFSWTLLAFFHAEIWTFVYLMNSLAEFNLNHTPLAIAPLPIVSAVGVLVLLLVGVMEKRGTGFEQSEIIAEEVHSGRRLTLLFLIPVVVLAPISMAIPLPVVRLAMSVVAVIMLGVFAMAWDGFHYYFTRHGVEIRTLGFRLKSIPLLQIKSYDVASWNPLRGLGIRGVGNRKAYIWGLRGVRVQMYDGEIFLGADNPQRIVRDLNAIKGWTDPAGGSGFGVKKNL